MTILGNLIAQSSIGLASVPVAMMLDDVLFCGPEVPTSIRIGGSQGIAKHHLPGGGRIIDVMGPDESAIQWTGLLVGSGASAKATLLSLMRRQGGVRQLSFGDTVVSVIVTRLEYAYQAKRLLIPYALRAEIIQSDRMAIAVDQIDSTTALADVNSASMMVGNGLNMMSTYSGLTTPPMSMALSGPLDGLTTASTNFSSMLDSSSATSSTTLLSAQQALESCLVSVDAETPASLNDIGTVSNVISTLLSCSLCAAAASARGYVARAYVNSL